MSFVGSHLSEVVNDIPGRERGQSQGRPESEGGSGGSLSGPVGESAGHIVDLWIMLTRQGLVYKQLDLSNCLKQWNYTIQPMFRK